MRIALVVTAVAFLTGCTVTPSGLKSDPAALRSFDVDAGYQVVYRRLVNHHKECAYTPLLPIGHLIYDAQNYTDIKMAQITQGSSGFGNTQIDLLIEITEAAPNKSHVKVWSYFVPERVTARIRKTSEGIEGCNP